MSTLPDEAQSKQAFLVLEREFSGGLGSPVEIVVDGSITPPVMAAIDDMQAALKADPVVRPVDGRGQRAGDVAMVRPADRGRRR